MNWGLRFVGRRAARRSALLAAKVASQGHMMSVPAVDPDHVVIDFDDADDAPPLTFHMTYRDSHGQVSGRLVTVRSVREEVGDIRVGCHCHGRDAYRCFLASRIVQITDTHTGEVHEDAMAFFHDHALRRSMTADTVLSLETMAMQECRDEVAIMAAVACADGHFSEEERDAIVLHVMNRTPEEGMRESEIRRRISTYGPDPVAYERSLQRVCQGAGDARALLHSLRRLIDADGKVDPEEARLVVDIEDSLRAAGRL